MKKYLYAIGFLLCVVAGAAQKHDYIWLQGYDSDAGEPGIEASILDFNFSPVKVDSIRTGGGFFVSSTSIADQEGVLQFYTDGCDI